ncbi:MAG: phenylalanine--tRNA ligase subunit beta [Myxococcota bacterium]
MRLPLSWLSEFVDLPDDKTLEDKLNMSGFEDAFVEDTGPDLSGVVVGRVEAREAHPNAERLSVCSVDVGDGTLRAIVCGAPNVAADQKVAVALPGTRLPDGTKIKKSKLRGVASEGMICSERELGLGQSHEGIWVLPEAAEIGAPIASAVSTGERILEVGITPNRGDTASLLGIAREVRALFGDALTLPPIDPHEDGAPASDAIQLRIDAPSGCFHYVARIVRGVRVGPSPPELQARLEASGIRAINNIVDVTNAVLLEFGQPLHAFDLAKLGGGEVRVRAAEAGETLETLDGQERKLDPRDLVIADASRPIALAGVMGGAATEVGEGTTDLLIESAHFDPVSVRLSARRHGIHSEASYRFERGVDRMGVARAADRAARWIQELAGGTVAPGRVEAQGDAAPFVDEVTLRVPQANRLLGLDLDRDRMARLLQRVEVEPTTSGDDALVCRIPSHRNDLQVHQDLTEEVARMHGYDQIPTTMPVAELAAARVPPTHQIAEHARDQLAAAGLVEVANFPFTNPADLAALADGDDDPLLHALRLANPIQEQDPLLRTTLLPSLLRLVRQNASRQVAQIGLFEVARVFRPKAGAASDAGEAGLPQETLWAAGVLTEDVHQGLWSGAPAPAFFQAKGIAEKALSGLGYVASLRGEGGPSYLHPGASAELRVGKKSVGCVGELHPAVAAAFEIEERCAIFELNLSALLTVKTREFQFREVSREPSVQRDLAVLVDRAQPAGELQQEIRKIGGPDLVSVTIFDRYEGRGVPEGRVSVAFRLVFQRADRTLTDAEVTRHTDRMVKALDRRFGAELR